MITINEFKRTINKNSNSKYSFSNLWKKDGRNILCMGMFVSGGLWSKSYYSHHVELDLNGRILGFYEQNTLSNKHKQLIGKQIDLTSIKESWNKIIKNRPVGVESSKVVGFIADSGSAVILNNKNLKKYPFQDTCMINNKEEMHGGIELKNLFVSLIQKYPVKYFSFSHNCSYDTYCEITIGDIEVSLSLRCFFDYSLQINFKTKESRLSLHNQECLDFDSVLTEVVNKNLSVKSKALYLLNNVSSIKRINDLQVINDNQVIAEVAFDDLRTPYSFQLDFKKKTVQSTKNVQSKVFVPKMISRLTDEMKTLAKENYYF